MKKRFLLGLALVFALVFAVTSIAIASQTRDGTAPAAQTISALIPAPVLAPAITISPQQGVGVVTTIWPQPLFARGTSLKFLAEPLIEVIHPLLCHSSALANFFVAANAPDAGIASIINDANSEVTATARMASSKNIHLATEKAVG